jgi:hypothetical protein
MNQTTTFVLSSHLEFQIQSVNEMISIEILFAGIYELLASFCYENTFQRRFVFDSHLAIENSADVTNGQDYYLDCRHLGQEFEQNILK